MLKGKIQNLTEEELKEKKIAFISLGCDKNRVDLEEMMNDLGKFGFTFTNSNKAQIVIINTCAFILSARKESIDNILEMAQLKKYGALEKIVVTGCLCQKYLEELKKHLPEVDRFVEIKDNENIVEIIASLYGVDVKFPTENRQYPIAPKHYAFLKIADGCNNGCAYCTIPRIRGRYTSVPFNKIISRAKQLVRGGAKEIIVVAQDTTRYGYDLYGEYRLPELLTELSKIKGLAWIRLHYCYPELVTDELLGVLSTNYKVCPYIDIPLQHIDEKMLISMNRRSREKEIRELITKIKTKYPEIAIRSTFIVGFPGETNTQFKKLCKFLEDARLDNVGFFAYSREEGTPAFYMRKQVLDMIKQSRLRKVEEIQEQIAEEKNLAQIGQTVEILIDSFNPETGYYEARTKKMSPNVDFFVKIPSGEFAFKVGGLYDAQLISYEDYSFTAEILIPEEILGEEPDDENDEEDE